MTFYSDVFIVRIWHEPSSGDGNPEWRGMVEHVRTGEKRYFIHLNQARDFIASYAESGQASSYGRRRWKRWLTNKRRAILKHLGLST